MEQKAKLKKFKVIVSEKETKEGRKFNVYKAVTNEGRLIDCKFRKEVKNLPEKTCYVHVYNTEMNIDKSREYPTLWVKAIEEIEEIGNKADDTTAVDEIF